MDHRPADLLQSVAATLKHLAEPSFRMLCLGFHGW